MFLSQLPWCEANSLQGSEAGQTSVWTQAPLLANFIALRNHLIVPRLCLWNKTEGLSGRFKRTVSARCLAPSLAPQPLAHWHSSRSPQPQSTERLGQQHPSYHFPCISLLFFPGSPTYHAFCKWSMHHRDFATQGYINILSLLIKCTLLILFHSKMPPSLKLMMATPCRTMPTAHFPFTQIYFWTFCGVGTVPATLENPQDSPWTLPPTRVGRPWNMEMSQPNKFFFTIQEIRLLWAYQKPSPNKSHWDKFFLATETRNTNDTYQKEKSYPLTQRSARHDLLGCCLWFKAGSVEGG